MKQPELSHTSRIKTISKLPDTNWDVIIIGGGITGAGTALECVKNGWKTLLIEKGDFASGTSSKSSGMIHGGLRYLEHGNFSLVKEALKERYKLGKIAPNLVKPNRFLFPVYDSWIQYIKIKIGLILYDLFAGKFNLQKHRRITRNEILKNYPKINKENLIGGFLYSDSLVSDSHLVLSVLSTAKQYGLELLNYVSIDNFEKAGKLFEVNYTDLTQNISDKINSKIVVSCTGVWSDKFLKNNEDKLIRPTKGVHIIIPYELLPIPTSFVLPSEDGRILFANRVNNFLYIGTTDTDYSDSFENISSNLKDVEYILHKINSLFPSVNLRKSDIIATYAGLRPLLNSSGNPSKLSREDFILDDDGFVVIVGGKLTTYRCMAKKVVIKLGNYLKPRPIKTNEKLNIIQFFEDILEVQVEKYLKYSMVLNLTDMMDRRLNLYRFDINNGLENLDFIAEKMGEFLNWDENEKSKQKQDYLEFVNSNRCWD